MISVSKSGTISSPICAGNRSSIELYRKCVENDINIFISNATWVSGSSSSDKFYLLDESWFNHFVKPKDGLIKFNKTETFVIVLDSNFEYIMEFHDSNFVIQTSNPDIVPKNMLVIEKNVYTHIYLKVNMCNNKIAVRLTLKT